MASEKSHTDKVSSSEVKKSFEKLDSIKKEISKVFFGHEEVTNSLIRCVLCNGHILLEGVPGIAKTLIIKTIAKISGCSSKRIQFTIDLLPADIVGLVTYEPHKGFEIVKGPIFTNFVIADEINRSTPKTQSALLEAMQEKQVTIGNKTFELPNPFFVMANQNPIETEGVYSLPEAQIDRFIFKTTFGYPLEADEEKIMEKNVTIARFEDLNIKQLLSPNEIIKMQHLTNKIYLDRRIKLYILDIVKRTRSKNFKYGEFIELGASPRASIYLYIASKSEALLRGRNYVIPKDVDAVAHSVLRHRIFLSYRAAAEGLNTDKIIDDILRVVRAP